MTIRRGTVSLRMLRDADANPLGRRCRRASRDVRRTLLGYLRSIVASCACGLAIVLCMPAAHAEDGYDLWLRYRADEPRASGSAYRAHARN